MKIACITDMGRSRETNEDSFLHYKCIDDSDLLIVADGMGGHNAGEIASSIAVKSIAEYIKNFINSNLNNDELIQIIKDSILKANGDIFKQSKKNRNYHGMGTTVTVAIITKFNMLVGHVGDSRAYVLKDNKLNKITSDHSLVAELVKNGTITEAEAQHHPQKNIITRALGTSDTVQIDIEETSVAGGDIIMLCTDGLTNMLSDQDIEDILIQNDNVEISARKMVEMANNLGGYDNITVVIAKVTYPEGEVK